MDLFEGLPDPLQGGSSSAAGEGTSFSTRTLDLDLRSTPRDVNGASGPRMLMATAAEDAGLMGSGKRKLERDTNSVDGHNGKRPATDESRGFRTEMQGERDDMEDHSVMVDQVVDDRMRGRSDICNASFYGVFDGHSGKRASTFMAEQFLDLLLSAFSTRGGPSAKDLDGALISAMLHAYKAADAAFLTEAAQCKPPWKDGTTATTALVINNKVYFANVGDSKAVLCRCDRVSRKPKVLSVTVDHIPTVYEERQRIQQQGGSVKEGRLNGILEVSRSIGDLPYKKNSGLSCVPSIQKCQLTEDDRFIIIACDGLWKALSPHDAVQVVLDTIENADEEELEPKYYAASVKLAKEALKRLSGDNVTVVVVQIKKLEK